MNRPAASPVETIAELHSKLGNACMVRGDLESAAANYKAALRLAPASDGLLVQSRQRSRHRPESPRTPSPFISQALKLNPRHWATRTNLVQALMATKQYIIAKALLLELLGERPQDGQLRHQLGKVHFELKKCRTRSRVSSRRSRSIRAMPTACTGSAASSSDGRRSRRPRPPMPQAARIQPLIRRPAIKSPADFRVLALYAPFAGNTPTEYLFKDAAYDTDTLAMFASSEYDAEPSGRASQVVVNLISDADQAGAHVAAGRRSGRPARQAHHQRSPQDPAHDAGRGRGPAGGNTGLPDSENLASARPAPIFPLQPCRPHFAGYVPHSGPAGRHPWRR